jgi:hypothetical protein
MAIHGSCRFVVLLLAFRTPHSWREQWEDRKKKFLPRGLQGASVVARPSALDLSNLQ